MARIVIAGAGAIGCFTGGLLARGGHQITLLGRARVLDAVRENGLTVSDFSGLTTHIAAADLTLSEDPACLSLADLVIVTVKTSATAEIAQQIAKYAPPDAPVLSWQNGITNADTLRSVLPDRDIRAGMVPFNVVPKAAGSYHRATSGDIVIEAGPGALGQMLNVPDLAVTESERIKAVQWGKLLINLNNALNALSGLTLQEQLLDRTWRRLMADQMQEALSVLRAAGIPTQSTTPLATWMLPHVLRLPTPLFSRIAARMLTIDPHARTSMAYDLLAGRVTEIDTLQGEIIALGQRYDHPTPICARVAVLIRSAPDQALSPDDIRST
ncbi:2-dehydropantoate 2-reductase [Ruegeria sp. 2012CJ41-6]|uniref:2-dehydropantoate 2-reductase n=1 Tax=Ruegeria spongiae TaxID=2942209 RepID=A0ABT0Q5G6_9RHOB|nr:2-dehydropantoate 2-reductase [Ruegeria spongiae]MCL6285113.1 2-dehydropantoate 2-reductase [Ruegeria spongiae]